MFHKSIEGNQPLIATAIHNGNELRDEVALITALDEENRFREEDPYTGTLTTIAQNQLVVYRSRFEVDLNRPREKAVYLVPEDAWGFDVWKEPPTDGLVTRSLQEYDGFYSHVHQICTRMEKTFGRFVVLDLHSYNHRRQGADAPPADPDENPEVNIGTGTMNREKWANLVDRFIHDLQAFDYFGRSLDVRENVKFRGGQFVRYIHETFPESGCAIAVEFKKYFMDEWTGMVDHEQLNAMKEALRSTLPGIMAELNTFGSKA
jgi:N-formylglutamate deformylase